MNTFANAVANQTITTTNGMKAYVASGNACTDLFFKIGASRGKDIIPNFVAAFAENEEYALRIAQWARDIRGGAGERQLFKDILSYLDQNDVPLASRLMQKVPEIGRWDDLLINYSSPNLERIVAVMFKDAISNGNALAAKWTPRKGEWALKLRKAWNMTPKQYRRFIVDASNTVEQQMCAKKWDEINFSHVPSLAASRYRTAFYRNAEARFAEYLEKLKAGDTSVKVNAGAVYPYDVLKNVNTVTAKDHAIAQWAALENFIGDANILPMVDVSGSMCASAGNSKTLSCMDVAVSLGLYCAEKNTGKFKDLVLTFSAQPQLVSLQGNIIQKYQQLKRTDWGMNTDLNKAFNKVLATAVTNNVPAEEMPEVLVILSDMQFDESQEKYGFCRSEDITPFNESALEMITRKYNEAGYTVPQIVFWNLNAYDNCPVKFDKLGTALVSGFSPSIMKAVLAADFEDFTPENIMLQTIMSERYDY